MFSCKIVGIICLWWVIVCIGFVGPSAAVLVRCGSVLHEMLVVIAADIVGFGSVH